MFGGWSFDFLSCIVLHCHLRNLHSWNNDFASRSFNLDNFWKKALLPTKSFSLPDVERIYFTIIVCIRSAVIFYTNGTNKNERNSNSFKTSSFPFLHFGINWNDYFYYHEIKTIDRFVDCFYFLYTINE